jgi:hypothetical protein
VVRTALRTDAVERAERCSFESYASWMNPISRRYDMNALFKRGFLAVAVVLFGAGAAHAAVGPEKPSQLVTLVSAGGDDGTCQGFPRFGRRVLADGTFVDGFAIPEKQAFVITAIEVNGQNFSPSRRQAIAILSTPFLIPLVTIYDQSDALGFVGTYQPISPVAVAAGTTLCLEVFDGLTIAKLHGFLTRDR